MSDEIVMRLMLWLVAAMQISIVVPMAVVWWRRRHFSPAVKLLSWYVYLSAAGAAGARFLYPAVFATNYGFSIGFNLGKIVLFGALYHQILTLPKARWAVLALSSAAVVGIFSAVSYNFYLAVSISRVVQCALLAGFALAYLEQTLNRPTNCPATHDPLWLLSVGQLLYSAGTVTAFSLEFLPTTNFIYYVKFSCVSVSGLVFNSLLTLAFLRAKLADSPVWEAVGIKKGETKQLAGS